MEAFSLAISIATGAYNPAAAPAGTGVPTATATARTVQIISKVVGRPSHRVRRWLGRDLAEHVPRRLSRHGRLAALAGPDPAGPVAGGQDGLLRGRVGHGPPDCSSTRTRPGPSSSPATPAPTRTAGTRWPLSSPTAMMPGNPHVSLWQNTVVRDALVAWSRPSDDKNATVVNGASVATWIGGRGSNVLSSGNLYNHNRYRAGLQHADLPEHAGHPGDRAGRPARAPGGHDPGRAGVRVLHDG